MNAYSRREARMVHRNITSGEFRAIFMEIAVVFHCTNPFIGIHLFSQVAGFSRVFAAKLLLLLVIFIRAVTAHYLIDVWTCEKGIIFEIRTIPALYLCVGC